MLSVNITGVTKLREIFNMQRSVDAPRPPPPANTKKPRSHLSQDAQVITEA